MHNHLTSFTPSSLRFTRWSRGGYAVFRSLSSSVSIGFLAVSISDCSLKVSIQNTVNQLLSNTFEEDDISDEEKSIAEFNALNLLVSNVTRQQSDCAALYIFYNNTHITVKIGSFLV